MLNALPMKPLLASSIVLLLAALSPAGEPIALRASRIITVDGADFEEGVVLIEGGKIRAVGKDIEVPWNAEVIRCPGGVAVPGLIHPHTTTGLRVANENLPDAPFVTVLDGIDPNAAEYRASLRDGVTAMHVIPGNNTRFGGLGAVLRPVGAMPEAMVIRSPSALKVSLEGPRGETRMGQMAALRRAFLELHKHIAGLVPRGPVPLETRPGSEAELRMLVDMTPDWKDIDWSKVPEDKIDERQRPLADLVRGRLPAFIYCPRASDVFKAFELMDVHGIRGTLVLGPDGYRAASVLAGRKGLGPVVIDPDLVRYEDDPETGEERRYLCARILHDAGVAFTVPPRDERGGRVFSRDPASHLPYQAARLIAQGIPPADALRAVTIQPARSLGLDHRMGSITPGKDANIAVFSGDPFDSRSWVDLVLIEGRVVYRRSEDRELQELSRQPARRF
jgi:imidazolonepropionase-like amidohydrolase